MAKTMHMHADDFREIVPGNDAVLAEYFGVTQREDGLLYVEGWRRGFDSFDLKGQILTTQLARHHEATIRQLEKRIAGLERDVAEAMETAMKYRGLVRLEARFGLMVQMERITG